MQKVHLATNMFWLECFVASGTTFCQSDKNWKHCWNFQLIGSCSRRRSRLTLSLSISGRSFLQHAFEAMRWREYEQSLWIWDGWQICQWSIPQRDIAKLINCAVSDKKLSRPLTYTWPRSSISEIGRFFTNSPTARITRSMSPFNQEGHVDRPRQMATESGAACRLMV